MAQSQGKNRCLLIKTLGGEALYIQIAEEIKKDLSRLRYGEQIPSEAELIERYQVSRGTVRQAISGLVNSGFLYRIQGKGTYRGNGMVNYDVQNYIPSFSNTMILVGKTPSISDIRLSSVKADSEISEALCIPQGEEVWALKRFRGEVGYDPICFSTAYILKDVIPTLKEDDLELSILDMITCKFKINISSTSNRVFVRTIGKELAKILNKDENTPALASDFIARSDDGRPFFYDKSINWGENFSYIIESKIRYNG